MSFLLRSNRKNCKRSTHLNTTVRVATPILRSAGGGQLQVQRPTLTSLVHHRHHEKQTQMEEKQHAVSVTPQQQLRVQNTSVSMEDVLKDLMILEQQQKEAEHKLQTARVTKQKRLEQQAAFEVQLDGLKYENGQLRAEIQRAREILSMGQRDMLKVEETSSQAGYALRSYNRKVQMAIVARRKLMNCIHAQARILQELEKKSTLLIQMTNESEQQNSDAKEEFNKATKFESTLRKVIHSEELEEKLFTGDTADVRKQVMEQESESKQNEDREKNVKLREERYRKDSREENVRHKQMLSTYESKNQELQIAMQQADEKMTRLLEVVSNKKSDLYAAWTSTIELQKSEGHPTSPLPSETNVIPSLDLDLIRKTVKSESDAEQAESKCKLDLSTEVEMLRKELNDESDRHQQLVAQVDTLKIQNSEIDQTESEREKMFQGVQDKLKQVRDKLKENTEKIKSFQLDLDSEVAGLRSQVDKLRFDVDGFSDNLQNSRDVARGVDSEIEIIRSAIKEEEKLGFNFKEQLRQARQNLQLIKVEKHSESELDETEQEQQHQTNDMIEEITDIFEKHPELEQCRFDLNLEQEVHENARMVLKPILSECRKRIKLAKEARIDTKKEETKQEHEKISTASKSTIGDTPSDLPDQWVEVSDAKPRKLLNSFVKASQEDLSDAESHSASRNNWETSICTSLSTSSKKVHWHDEGIFVAEHNTDTQPEPAAKIKRKVFGKANVKTKTPSRVQSWEEAKNSSTLDIFTHRHDIAPGSGRNIKSNFREVSSEESSSKLRPKILGPTNSDRATRTKKHNAHHSSSDHETGGSLHVGASNNNRSLTLSSKQNKRDAKRKTHALVFEEVEKVIDQGSLHGKEKNKDDAGKDIVKKQRSSINDISKLTSAFTDVERSNVLNGNRSDIVKSRTSGDIRKKEKSASTAGREKLEDVGRRKNTCSTSKNRDGGVSKDVQQNMIMAHPKESQCSRDGQGRFSRKSTGYATKRKPSGEDDNVDRSIIREHKKVKHSLLEQDLHPKRTSFSKAVHDGKDRARKLKSSSVQKSSVEAWHPTPKNFAKTSSSNQGDPTKKISHQSSKDLPSTENSRKAHRRGYRVPCAKSLGKSTLTALDDDFGFKFKF